MERKRIKIKSRIEHKCDLLLHPEVPKHIGLLTLLFAGITSIFSFKYSLLNDTVTTLKRWSESAGNSCIYLFNIMHKKCNELYSIKKIGTSETLRNETVITLENVKPISVHRVMDWITTWVRVKFRGHLKALVTKVLEETLRLALLMVRGMVTSLEIDLLIKKIGNRGSKSDLVCKRATSIRLFSITYLYCKMYSSRRETGYWEKIISTIFWIYILLVISIFVLVGFSPGLGLELFNLYYLGSPYNNLNTIYLRRNYSTLARGVC